MISPVVDSDWLDAHRSEVRIADVRWYLDGRSGRDAFESGHLPRAVFVDLDTALAGPPSPAGGRHPLPAPEVFAAGMAGAGISNGTTVIAYDDAGGTVAARLVWMLRVLGEDAALLDGGLPAWAGPMETGCGRPVAAGRFTIRRWPESAIATIDEAAEGANVVIDARDPARYRGEVEPVDPRPGHIPGAVNVPCRSNLDADDRFLPAAELRRRFEAAGAGGDRPVISYCGSGVTACHNLISLELAGFASARLFPGSWSQYSADGDRPAELGDG